MIRIEGLTKRFDETTAVENLELEIRSGEVFGFLGPNGAGKTTTLRMLGALINPTSVRHRWPAIVLERMTRRSAGTSAF